MESLGQFLKREREFRGFSLDDVEGMTKINSLVLARIENDKYEELPTGTYLKGYLKLYAKAIGINLEDVLTRYQNLPTDSKKEVHPFHQIGRFEAKASYLKS
ncbi:MAG: helix-turn-helix domain-containing protein [Deltaproteobacteria bacterium]|nr:MAG: helix-turn-helix domain-containing protein [Deltaproteobacteria bacterium]